ncbi:hypothetical protein LTS12_011844 [Elasticomyces elasticus]|nr:hypothetical protein LTS12_011844 [Elasticomyces elasticus]
MLTSLQIPAKKVEFNIEYLMMVIPNIRPPIDSPLTNNVQKLKHTVPRRRDDLPLLVVGDGVQCLWAIVHNEPCEWTFCWDGVRAVCEHNARKAKKGGCKNDHLDDVLWAMEHFADGPAMILYEDGKGHKSREEEPKEKRPTAKPQDYPRAVTAEDWANGNIDDITRRAMATQEAAAKAVATKAGYTVFNYKDREELAVKIRKRVLASNLPATHPLRIALTTCQRELTRDEIYETFVQGEVKPVLPSVLEIGREYLKKRQG